MRPHSWSPFWAEEALTRAKAAGYNAPNAFFMSGVDEPQGRKPEIQVRAPRDLEASGVSMAYIGEIVHRTE